MSGAAVIVQARMTSTRLPGKVLKDLAGHTVLHHVLRRCAAIPGIDSVCCAVPEGAAHDPIVAEAERAGAWVFRGSETDVLARYAGAARVAGAPALMRVTSDCPLIDPELCGRVLAQVRDGGADYACNNMPSSWPHGLDCEAFTAAALFEAEAEAQDSYEREHVTPWLRKAPHLRRANVPGPGGWAAEQRWTLDLPEDYAFFQALFPLLGPLPVIPSTADVLALLRTRPDIASINAGHAEVSRPQTPIAPKEIP